jgi:hypothetical protein
VHHPRAGGKCRSTGSGLAPASPRERDTERAVGGSEIAGA